MKAIDLTRTPGVLALARRAETLTAGNLHEAARVDLKLAVMVAVELLGVDERGCDVIGALIDAAGDDGSYDEACATGEVIVEAGKGRLLDHERDTREELPCL